ncbi:MAG: hypothetical protein ACJATE_002424, partial [Bacteroidia bacterium]
MEMKYWLSLFLSLITSDLVFAQDAEVEHTIYMIGDAGNGEKAALNALEDKLKKEGKHSSVIFLGNNVSPDGMPKKKRKRKRKAAE